ncbi:MAG: hypothetical protein KJ011_01455 [Burkholderiaceae bacterium]|nr:hypothetical protein [Burkholderiaceae bacterium]
MLKPWTPGLPRGLKNAYRERSDRPLMRVGFREHEIAQIAACRKKRIRNE